MDNEREQHDASPPPVATPEDLDYRLAYDAHRNSSHVPDKRARSEQEWYSEDVNGFYRDLIALAVTAEQRAAVAGEIARYRDDYLRHYGAVLSAMSRTASSMITGPAKFPVERNRRAVDAAYRRARDFAEWRKRARSAAKARVLALRTAEQRVEGDWLSLKSEIARSLGVIRDIDERGLPYTRSAFTTSIAGKVERLASAGQVELVERALALVREYDAGHKKPAFTPRHKLWALADAAKAARGKAEATVAEGEATVAEADGVRVVRNPALNRAQIVFADRPDEATRERLRSEGWRWSPTNGAWQRKLTEAAIASAKRIAIEGTCGNPQPGATLQTER